MSFMGLVVVCFLSVSVVLLIGGAIIDYIIEDNR